MINPRCVDIEESASDILALAHYISHYEDHVKKTKK